MHRRVRDDSLTIVLATLFLIFLFGQIATGYRTHNNDRTSHGESEIGLAAYLISGHSIEATFENWESEYLQMALFVFLTAFLFQRGSAESNDPDEVSPDAELRDPIRSQMDAPWPVRAGGLVLKIYENSLTIALFLLFLMSFALHAWGGAREFSEAQVAHGGPTVSVGEFMKTSAFWFQSFQNWQSEFLAVASLALLSIFLRQRGSPESKRVDAPNSQTGAK